MIDMRMREKNEIYGLGIEPERFIIQSRDFLGSLIHTTVNKKSCRPCFDHIAWAGDNLGGSTEREFHRNKIESKKLFLGTDAQKADDKYSGIHDEAIETDRDAEQVWASANRTGFGDDFSIWKISGK